MGLFSPDGATNATIGDLSIAVDKNGMEAYRGNLRVKLIVECETKLDDTEALVTAINAGWQGISRDKFLKALNKEIEDVKNDLEREYQDLNNRLIELESYYYKQDQEMVIDE